MTAPRHARLAAAPDVASRRAPNDDVGDPLRWVWVALISGLFFVRWWQPTEGTMLGHTLAIAEGWFLALALAGWVGIRGAAWRVRADAVQWAVWLLVAGHIVSGLVVVFTSGDRRAAVNMIWEWVALGVLFPLLRSVLSKPEARREWLVVALAAVVTLSGYGLTQRYWFYPQMVAEYERLRQELDTLEAAATDNGAINLPRIQKLRADLLASGLTGNMLSGTGRTLFEGRLKHSTDALGRFALANTFGGLLAVWWLILVVMTVRQFTDYRATVEAKPSGRFGRLSRCVVLVMATLIVGYCLLLTKSRTAYVGALVGLTVCLLAAALAHRWSWSANLRPVILWGLVTLFAAGGLTVLAGLTGGLDRLVLAEAPKSLQYRLEYWWSSLQVIRESPLVGVGPGQFRQHYLAHKLPRSSEEIADPHNLFLDVWANGGLLSLAGVSWLVYLLCRLTLSHLETGSSRPKSSRNDAGVEANPILLTPTVRESGTPPVPARKIPQPKAPARTGTVEPEITAVQFAGWSSPVRWGAVVGLLALWLVGGALETLPIVLLVVWLSAIWLLDVVLPEGSPPPWAWAAAGVGLVVHLCGAGGIAMPAITQLLLLISIFAAEGVSTGSLKILHVWQKWGVLVLGLTLFGGGYGTAVQPAFYSHWFCDQGDRAQSAGSRERSYRIATIYDPLDPEPWERLAEFTFQRWRATRESDYEEFALAVEAQRRAIDRNPFSFHTHRTLGMFYAEHARRTDNVDDKANAVRELQIALSRYPHNAALLADAAGVFALGNERQLAKLTARRALEQDDVNHSAGHIDKWLPDKQRQEMEKLAGLP